MLTRPWMRFEVVGTFFVLTSLFINLGLGRWGSYIQSPIPGLHLGDLVLVAGALLAIAGYHKFRSLPKVAWFCLIPLAYFLVHLTVALSKGDALQYNWIRDMAPFLYLSLVPFLAVSLLGLRPTATIWVTRWAALTYAAGFMSVQIGLVAPFNSDLLSSQAVRILEYRGDFTGFVMGLGAISWGRWRGGLRGHLSVQTLLIAVGLTSTSRASLLTLGILVAIAIVREWRHGRKSRALLAPCIAIATVLFIPVSLLNPELRMPDLSTNDRTVNSSDVSPLGVTLSRVESAILSEQRQATLRARADTYLKVLSFTAEDYRWVAGKGPGTDALYEACTGIREAPLRTVIVDEYGRDLFLPKCAIDSHEAPSTLRDPHNWILNIVLYQGLIGLAAILLVFVTIPYKTRDAPNATFGLSGLAGILIVSMFSVVASTPFGMVPAAVCLAFLLRVDVRESTTHP